MFFVRSRSLHRKNVTDRQEALCAASVSEHSTDWMMID